MFRHKTTWHTVRVTYVITASLAMCSLFSVVMIVNNTGGALVIPTGAHPDSALRQPRHADDVIGPVFRAPRDGRDHVRVLFEHDNGARRLAERPLDHQDTLNGIPTNYDDDDDDDDDGGDDNADDNEDGAVYNPVEDTDGYAKSRGTHSPINSSRQLHNSWHANKPVQSVIGDKIHHKNDDDDAVGDDNDDDDDDYADTDAYRYSNPPFKKGDFDYEDNKRLSPPRGEFRVSSTRSNDSLKYNSGQRKSMHLLENSQKTSHTELVIQRINSEINTRSGTDGRHGTSKWKLDNNNNNNNNNNNVLGSRRLAISPGNFGYRKDGVSYPSENNFLNREQIETQIPLQNGDVTSWLFQEPPATQLQTPELPWQPGEVRSPGGVPLIVDKIFWSPEVESLIARGITNEDFEQFLHKLQVVPVAEMHAPQWNRCGRPNNQYILLKDGTPLCARFRDEHVKLLHGELLSFSLSRVLGLDNVPIVKLSEANTRGSQWFGMNISRAGWNESSIVALIQWIHGLDSERSRVKMPAVILEAYEQQRVFTRHHDNVYLLSANNLTELVQWSDLILFDYLTGHYDRVASMQDGADRERRPSIMHENIRNLRKVWQTGKLWLIDNESGLFDGYELLYHGGEMGRKFVRFHRQMLTTNCVFRRQTVEKILQLSRLPRPEEALINYTMAQEPLYRKLPYANEVLLFKKYFRVRLKEVAAWISECQLR